MLFAQCNKQAGVFGLRLEKEKGHSKYKQIFPVHLINCKRPFVYFFMVQNCLIMCNQTLYNSMRYFTPENTMMVGNQTLISTLAVGIYVVKQCDVKCRSCSVLFMANTNLICGPLSFCFLFQFYFLEPYLSFSLTLFSFCTFFPPKYFTYQLSLANFCLWFQSVRKKTVEPTF